MDVQLCLMINKGQWKCHVNCVGRNMLVSEKYIITEVFDPSGQFVFGWCCAVGKFSVGKAEIMVIVMLTVFSIEFNSTDVFLFNAITNFILSGNTNFPDF